MDPQLTLMNETTSYSLSEIWPISINGEPSGAGLDLRRTPFGPNLTHFVEPNKDAARKRRDNINILMDDNNNNNNNNNNNDLHVKGLCTPTMSDSEGKRLKTIGQSGDDNENPKAAGGGGSGGGNSEQKNKPAAEPPPKDYIHVRARRGQATDSHSLAERARREKISERMRILQDLVPGCNKVIGKALVLDEIINYIQSLQHQVEFLSMKLEAVNSRMGPGIEGFPSKDFGQQAFDTSGIAYGSQTPREQYGRGSSPEWLHMQIGGGFDRQT